MAISPIVPEVSLLTRVTKTVLGWVGIRDAEQKMRENAANWLELAEKIYHYRRDVLPEVQVEELQTHILTLRKVLKERDNAAKLKLEIEALEDVMRRTGGAIYPKSALVENVEFFLVAAIVILGIRTYFVQPFKIPTNSMWPTYYGMTGETFPPGTPAPGPIEQASRLVAFGAQRKEVVAPGDGEVSALFFENGTMAGALRDGRSWLVFPAVLSEYTFFAGDKPVTLQLPVDFHRFEKIVIATYFGSQEAFEAEWNRQQIAGRLKPLEMRYDDKRTARVVRMSLGKTVKAGDLLLRFDLMTGDQLFVDRVSYHFMRPQVGQGFVFRTDNIRSIHMQDSEGRPIVSYYIKRLVGTPGDTLEVKSPMLYRNGQPITGAKAFEANSHRTGKYGGYTNVLRLAAGSTVNVPAGQYFAMGDNSADSADSRYWGFVPAKDVAGRPLFIYYPFTHRWGPAR